MQDFQLFRNIQKHVTLTQEEQEVLLTRFVNKTIDKKQRILYQGDLCRKLFFVESGSFRAYHVNDSGKESTIMFAIQDWWITDMNAFVNQAEALFSIEALELSKIWVIDYSSLENLYITLPKFERFFRILFQNAYIREQVRALESISLSTGQRYQKFVNKYPAIVEKITQKQIASYLGVTPEFLSSVKRKQ